MRLDDYQSAAKYYMKASKLTPENDICARDSAIALEKLGRSVDAFHLLNDR
jgi:Flp pilus assembly protein TadD